MSFKKESFTLIKYLSFNGSGGGQSPTDAIKLPTADAVTIADLEEGMVVESCTVVVETALTGPSGITVGDEDDADGFAATSAYGSAGAFAGAGAYIATNPKYYPAAKSLKVTAAGSAASTGLIEVCLKGFRV